MNTSLGVVVGLAIAGALSPWAMRWQATQSRLSVLGGGEALSTGVAIGPSVDVTVVMELITAALHAGASIPRALDAVGAALGHASTGYISPSIAEQRPGPTHQSHHPPRSVGASEPAGITVCGRAAEVHPLSRVSQALVLGARWGEAWNPAQAVYQPVARALQAAWEQGASPSKALASARVDVIRQRSQATAVAAGRLAVRLVLPLGACFLPAFVLIGLVPVLMSLGGGLFS